MSDSFPASIHRQLALVQGEHGWHVYFVVDAAATRLRKAHRLKASAFRRVPR